MADVLSPSPQQVPDTSQSQPSVFEQAQSQWPILRNPNIVYMDTPDPKNPNKLEAWPPGESGTLTASRPKDIPIDKYGIQTFHDVRPIDVLGDVVSHFLVQSDPTLKDYYSRFEKSLTPEQEARIKHDYSYAREHERERRPYNQWRAASRLPAYFRGYAFQQWPQDFTSHVYTPEQRQMFDQMMQYLASEGR